MDQKVCVDSDVTIELLRNNREIVLRYDKLRSAQFYISAISLFELLQRETRVQELLDRLEDFEILPIDEYAAAKGAEIMRHLKKTGKPVDFRDVLIAASCLVEGCTLFTLNKKHFTNIKELRLL